MLLAIGKESFSKVPKSIYFAYFKNRYKEIEMKELLWKCTFLDPRFKNLHLSDEQHIAVVKLITEEGSTFESEVSVVFFSLVMR